MLDNLKKELQSLANPEKAKILQKFFKTGKGQYGEGDIFLGIIVPEQRRVAGKYDLSLKDISELLDSEIHEERLVGIFILISKYKKATMNRAPKGVYPKGTRTSAMPRDISKEMSTRGKIFNFYLSKAERINNWDLVDLSAPNIVGDYLFHNKEEMNKIYEFAHSENLWKKRIAILSTFYFIRKEKFDDTLAIAEILLNDSHDLIHKAVGWMLREIGKRDLEVEEEFLRVNYKDMPRTMLRYAIERFEEGKRKAYLKGEI